MKRATLPATGGHPLRTLALVLAVLIYPTTLLTQERPALEDVSSLRCTFESQIGSQRWEPGSRPELSVGEGDWEPLQFFVDSIDRENQKARMIGNVASVDLAIIPSSELLHLIELTPAGGLNVLTIHRQLSDDSPCGASIRMRRQRQSR